MTEATENLDRSSDPQGRNEAVVMCDYCKHLGDVPAAHEFETVTGARTFTCEQHTNIAMTCLKHIGPIST